MKQWKNFNNYGQMFDLTHLKPFTLDLMINGAMHKVHVHFGHHVFTDQKDNGAPYIYGNDNRSFSPERHQLSLGLPAVIKSVLSKQEQHATAHHNKANKECYYYVNTMDYTLFLEIRKPNDTPNTLKMKVVTAYEQDSWGGQLPKGRTVKVGYILSERAKGNQLLARASQKKRKK